METLIVATLVGLLVVALLFYFFKRPTAAVSKKQKRDASQALSPGVPPMPTFLEQKVLTQMRGDRARLDSALRAAQQKYPRASRGDLLNIVYEESIQGNE
ncbi:hypothetical protein [Deinococcus navajonensis]|uniref:Uncharacterized protein n=1 Tax=Deinococcus navajonensis TaxID=309884 RepID=A0ABV8XQS2_9DEIO